MLIEKDFVEYLRSFRATEETVTFSIDFMNQFESFSKSFDSKESNDRLTDIKAFCSEFIAGKDNSLEKVIAFARYNMFIKRESAIIYLITMLGTFGVLESIQERMNELVGEKKTEEIFHNISKPPLGSIYETYPPIIKSLLDEMQQKLPFHTCKNVLAGNHHNIPIESFQEDKKKYEDCGSIDAFLVYHHAKFLKEIEECMLADKLWYEQRITPLVIEFIKNNPEIHAGVREGNKLYITKIPYDSDPFLRETDPQKKRFLACHCPFVRSSIADGAIQVPKLWCYCTGGFEKLRYDVIFDKSLDVEVLETVLNGDDRCRFAITLPQEVKY
jgi:hypothetical protein